jgi:hypothetical protein
LSQKSKQVVFIIPFPPPCKENLPSDALNQQANWPSNGNAVNLYRSLFPWGLCPGTGVVVLSKGTPPSFPTLPFAEDDTYRIERRELSYLSSYILSSWQRGVLAWEAEDGKKKQVFPMYEQVMEMESLCNCKKFIDYNHPDMPWRSSFEVKCDRPATKLIVHLANDGFLYLNPSEIEVDQVQNRRYKNTCPEGWLVFKQGEVVDRVKTQLSDFRAFAVVWFGTDDIHQSVLYNPSNWRIDICFEHKTTNIGLGFSFQPDWPVPAEDYWRD